MSMMMYPPEQEQLPGLPLPPGDGGTPPMPMDALNAAGGLPAEDGMAGLMAALGGGGMPPEAGMMPEELPPEGEEEEDGELDPVEHIQQAMKHLMMALAKEEDEERGQGLVKGMGALQSILAGEQKTNAQLQQIGG
jgi:hypothetical protein